MFLGLSCCVWLCVILYLLMTAVNVECDRCKRPDPAVAHVSVSFGAVFTRCDWFELLRPGLMLGN